MQIGWFFYWTLAAVSLFCFRQAVILRRPVSPAQAFSMFQQHVWIGVALLAGLIGGFVL
jgi:4-hydroxybenzoate polyprenyltransferase